MVSLSLSFSLPITYFEKSSLVVRAQGRLLTRINHEPLTRNKAAARASGLRHPSRAQTRRHTYNTLYVRIYVPSSMTAADFSHCPRKFGICRRRGGEYSRVSRCSRVPLSWDYGLSSGGGDGGQYKGLARREYNAMMHFRHADKFAVYFPSRRECLRFMSSVCVCVCIRTFFICRGDLAFSFFLFYVLAMPLHRVDAFYATSRLAYIYCRFYFFPALRENVFNKFQHIVSNVISNI